MLSEPMPQGLWHHCMKGSLACVLLRAPKGWHHNYTHCFSLSLAWCTHTLHHVCAAQNRLVNQIWEHNLRIISIESRSQQYQCNGACLEIFHQSVESLNLNSKHFRNKSHIQIIQSDSNSWVLAFLQWEFEGGSRTFDIERKMIDQTPAGWSWPRSHICWVREFLRTRSNVPNRTCNSSHALCVFAWIKELGNPNICNSWFKDSIKEDIVGIKIMVDDCRLAIVVQIRKPLQFLFDTVLSVCANRIGLWEQHYTTSMDGNKLCSVT